MLQCVFNQSSNSLFTFFRAEVTNASNRQKPYGATRNLQEEKHLQFYLVTLVYVLCADLEMNNKRIWMWCFRVK